jgi:putative endonuclease
MVAERLDRHRQGSDAEAAAARLLEGQGFHIRARNVRFTGGELALVAERDELRVFVEVRMRTTAFWGDPGLTITWRKQRRIVQVAQRYLIRERIRRRAIRFDGVTVQGRGANAALQHIPNAFDAGE